MICPYLEQENFCSTYNIINRDNEEVGTIQITQGNMMRYLKEECAVWNNERKRCEYNK